MGGSVVLEKVSEEGRSEEKEFELNVFLGRSHTVKCV